MSALSGHKRAEILQCKSVYVLAGVYKRKHLCLTQMRRKGELHKYPMHILSAVEFTNESVQLLLRCARPELKRQRANANFFAGAFFISNVYCARRIVPHKYDRERHFRAMLLHLTYFCRHFRAQTLCQLLTVYYVQVRSP